MSDYTTQGGTDWELKEAENAIVAAGNDPAALALAMRRHTEAQRNMMQGVLVPSFERTVSVLIDKSATAVIAEVHISIEQMMGLVQQVLATAREALTVAKAGTARLGKLEKDVTQLKRAMNASKVDRKQIRTEVASVKSEVVAIQARLDYQDEIERRLRALEARGGGTDG